MHIFSEFRPALEMSSYFPYLVASGSGLDLFHKNEIIITFESGSGR